jgi:hypothetical protein
VFEPIWEHCLGYWDLSVREPNNVLFLNYDEIMAQPARHVRMLAEFLGVPFTIEEESGEVVEEVVRLCSNLKNMSVNSDGVVVDQIGAIPTKISMFFRRGGGGGRGLGEPLDRGDGSQARSRQQGETQRI